MKNKKGEMYKFIFYVAGKGRESLIGVEHLKKILDKKIKNNYEIKIIDIIKEPAIAEKKKIIATPMLEKVSPGAVRRIVGDFSDKEKIIMGLDLHSAKKK